MISLPIPLNVSSTSSGITGPTVRLPVFRLSSFRLPVFPSSRLPVSATNAKTLSNNPLVQRLSIRSDNWSI